MVARLSCPGSFLCLGDRVTIACMSILGILAKFTSSGNWQVWLSGDLKLSGSVLRGTLRKAVLILVLCIPAKFFGL